MLPLFWLTIILLAFSPPILAQEEASQHGFISLGAAEDTVQGAAFSSEFWEPGGAHRSLVVSSLSPAREGRRVYPLPFPADQVVWAGLVAPELAVQLTGGVVLEGEGTPVTAVSDVSPLVEGFRTDMTPAPPQGGGATRELTRSGWIWKPEAWRGDPDGLFAKLREWKMSRVYITVPATDQGVETAGLLESFIARASGLGVEVWAVDGDRYALLPESREPYLTRARAYAVYNARVSEEKRLSGVQYDIEPYLMPGYALRAAEWNEEYARLLGLLKELAQMPLEIAVPFWFDQQQAGGRRFLEAIVPAVDSVVVMDYRTDLAEVRRFARPFLRWGDKYDREVHIALETVALPDSGLSMFRPASAGTLWLSSWEGLPILFLLEAPQRGIESGRLFAYSHGGRSLSSRTTFHGREEELRGSLETLERDFAAWPSFAGLAVHGTE